MKFKEIPDLKYLTFSKKRLLNLDFDVKFIDFDFDWTYPFDFQIGFSFLIFAKVPQTGHRG